VARIDLMEKGKTGLQAWSGQVTEAYSTKLQWPAAYAIYDEMRRRDPGIRSMLNAQMLLSRTASWYFEAGGTTDADKRAAEHLEECLHDMSHTIEDAIEDALSCVWFGWFWQEVCYKRRADGRIGWRKWAERRQSAFYRWDFDDAGGVQAMVQRPAPSYDEIAIPIGKSLHYRGQRDGGNPEGWALAESVYEPWYFLKNLHIISGIGWERTFVGLPVFEIEEKTDTADDARIQAVGEALIVGEKQYVAVPPGVKFRLETVHNTSTETLLNQIKYERRTMMQTLLADWLDLGTGQTGSWALGSDKSQLFLMAVDGLLDRMAAIVNRFAVPQLVAYNAWAFPGVTAMPKLAHKKVEKPAMAQLGAFLQQVNQLLTWTDEDQRWLRTRMGMPTIEVGSREATAEDEPADEDGEDGRIAGTARRAPTEMAMLAAGDGDPDEVRDPLEDELAGEMAAFLEGQGERVIEGAGRDAALADDESFWEDEGKLMLAALLPAIIEALNALGEANADAIDIGVEWSEANAHAMVWARSYAFDLVGGLNGTTREALREALATWAETGGDVQVLERLLAPTFGEKRARAIAGTEITRVNAAAASATGSLVGVVYALQPPSRTNCRCWTIVRVLPDGRPVGVWMTAADDRVSRAQRIITPWGDVVSDADLHGVIVSEGPWLGMRFEDAAADVRLQA